jgi:hypothetical protein
MSMKNISITCLVLFVIIFLSTATRLNAQENNGLSNGQTIYVPAYSHIYAGNNEVRALLAVTLSIRNTDINHPIEILSVDYYETQGQLLKKFIASPLALNALGTARYTIPYKDKSGGSGANFIVRWKSLKPVNSPIVETIMVGPRSSFTSRGQAIFPSE